MRNTIDEKARRELKELDEEARDYASTARVALSREAAGKSSAPITHALLAIEARLAMATSFLLWALEADDATD